MNALPPDSVYWTYFALTGAGIAGFALAARRARSGADRADALLRHYLVAVILATLAAHLWVNLQLPQPQGRHLFGAAPQIACVLSLGLWGLPWLRRGPGLAGALAGLFALALYCLHTGVRAVYQ
jgi:hypothetical protein